MHRPTLSAVVVLGLVGAGLTLGPAGAQTTAIEEPQGTLVQVLATNDFHGRINASGLEAGVAVMAGAVNELRAEHPNTVFAAAGDLIGATTFESFVFNDKPTIDALNQAGLEVSAVGNHELDQGYDDLVNRVMAPYDADTNPDGGAEWEYIAANIERIDGEDTGIEETWIQQFGEGDEAIRVGFVGAVTEELPSLVAPGGIADIEVTDIVESVNAAATDLRQDEDADLVVLLVHEGAADTTYATATDPGNTFGQIVNNVSDDVDAIVSGHTHLAYNHSVPVPGWADRAVTERPVVSAGQYGYKLNQLLFDIDPETGEVLQSEQNVLDLVDEDTTTNPSTFTPNYTADPDIADFVAGVNEAAAVPGSVVIGELEAPLRRARSVTTSDNRGGESTLGNLVAEVQRAQSHGEAEIAFMNPGGLRANLDGTPNPDPDAFPRDLTYRQAAVVQPFANGLVNMGLTGAQVKTALEQQWQRNAAGEVPSRPFLKLGVSEGFRYTFDPARPEGDRITRMWLHDEEIDLERTYSVTVNAFLSTGGDNFRVFREGVNPTQEGYTDLAAMVDYLADLGEQNQGIGPDFAQRSVGVSFPADAPTGYAPGDEVTFSLSSLGFSAVGDTVDESVTVSLGDEPLGDFPVDTTLGNQIFDDFGTAEVTVTLPQDTPVGAAELTITGETTGTTTAVPVQVRNTATVTATVDPRNPRVGADEVVVDITVASSGEATPTGQVRVGVNGSRRGAATLDDEGRAQVTLPAFGKAGPKQIRVNYVGDDVTSAARSAALPLTVRKAKASIRVERARPTQVRVNRQRQRVRVRVAAPGITPRGVVRLQRGGRVVARGELNAKGRVRLTLPRLQRRGIHTFRVVYLGTPNVTKARVQHRVRAVR